jgi:hypothetical protein
MSTEETIVDLATYNLWRRGDETIEMPSPAKIGATIDRAVSLLRKYHDLERELAESRNAERLARVQVAHERERSRLFLVAMNERDDGYIESRKRMSALESALNAERDKVGALRLACERIVEQWDKNHDAAPFHAGNVMYSRASAALAATEDAQ